MNQKAVEVRAVWFEYVEPDFHLPVVVIIRFDYRVASPGVSVDVLCALGVWKNVVLALGQVVPALVVAREADVRIFRADEDTFFSPSVTPRILSGGCRIAHAGVIRRALLNQRILLGGVAYLAA